MIALYIILGISALISAILFIHIGIGISYKNQLIVSLRVGFLRFTLLPSRADKINYKKEAKKLRNKKETVAENKENKAKEKKKIRFERKASPIENFISKVSELSEDPESVRFLLIAVKELAEEFPKALEISVYELKAVISSGNAALDCIKAGALSGAVKLGLELLDGCSVLSVNYSGVSVSPGFSSENNTYTFSISIRIRVIYILKSFIKSFINNSNTKSYTVKKGNKK